MLARIPRQLTTYLSSIRIVVQSHRCVTNAHKRITNGSQHPAEGLYIWNSKCQHYSVEAYGRHIDAIVRPEIGGSQEFWQEIPCFVLNVSRQGYVSKLVRGKDMCQKSCHLLIHSSQCAGGFMGQKWRIYGISHRMRLDPHPLLYCQTCF